MHINITLYSSNMCNDFLSIIYKFGNVVRPLIWWWDMYTLILVVNDSRHRLPYETRHWFTWQCQDSPAHVNGSQWEGLEHSAQVSLREVWLVNSWNSTYFCDHRDVCVSPDKCGCWETLAITREEHTENRGTRDTKVWHIFAYIIVRLNQSLKHT